MARNASGTHSNPLPNVAAGDTIEAAWANTSLSDFSVEITDSLSRTGKGNMSVPLKVVDGTVAAPGLSFSSEAGSGLYRASAGDLRIARLGTEIVRLTSAGVRTAGALTVAASDLTMTAGNLIPSTAGKGVDFAAQTATAAAGAATTAEVLGHYEEGTWTPTIIDASLSTGEGQTYATQQGVFTRIGNTVFVEGYVELSAIGTLAGQAFLGGLPYTAKATYYGGGINVHSAANMGTISSSDSKWGGYIAPSTSYVTLTLATTGGLTAVATITNLGSTGELIFSGFYFV